MSKKSKQKGKRYRGGKLREPVQGQCDQCKQIVIFEYRRLWNLHICRKCDKKRHYTPPIVYTSGGMQ